MRHMRRDAGFSMAALVIFLTAASILLTISVPSYVMQARREQEKELIFRGEEYARAIQKYQRTLNLLPSSADDLLSSNGTRFLRKAYADPVSGEPWRIIILNADGTLTGSNVYQSMSQVPTTTSVANTAAPNTAKAGSSIGTLPTNSGGTSGLGVGGGGAGTAGGAGGLGGGVGTGVGGGGGNGLNAGSPTNNGQRPATGGTVAPTPQQAAQPQSQPTPLTGIVGVGSGSKGPGVMVYNKQEQYSNWEFLAQLQQRTNPGAAGGAGGGGGAGGAARPGGTGAAPGTGGAGTSGAGGAAGAGGAGGAGAGGAGAAGGARR
jgi:type II secretory pathway pseudopilin PulG